MSGTVRIGMRYQEPGYVRILRRASAPTGTSEHTCKRGSMIVEHHTLECRTHGRDHIVDLTERVQATVSASGVGTGQAALLVEGSTASLTTLEYEPGLAEHDIAAALERVAPREGKYVHEETWHDDNGHSHVRASLIGPALALPIVGGRIPLGTWQQIVLVDSDTRPRGRTVHMSVIGIR